jgi:hypothetical protein
VAIAHHPPAGAGSLAPNSATSGGASRWHEHCDLCEGMWSRSQVLGLLVLIAIPAAAGCATPAAVVRLYPRGDEFVWVSGLVAAFDHQDPQMLGLRVEVENDSGQAVEIDPDDMTFTTCTGPSIKSCAPGRGVIDPERMINRLDARRSREAADATNDQAFLAPFFILGALGDIASAGRAPFEEPRYCPARASRATSTFPSTAAPVSSGSRFRPASEATRSASGR